LVTRILDSVTRRPGSSDSVIIIYFHDPAECHGTHGSTGALSYGVQSCETHDNARGLLCWEMGSIAAGHMAVCSHAFAIYLDLELVYMDIRSAGY
jgi:hypothetical protein